MRAWIVYQETSNFDEANMPASFVSYLIARLAHKACHSIAQDATREASLASEAQMAWLEAKRDHDSEYPADEIYTNGYIDAHTGYYGSDTYHDPYRRIPGDP